MFQLSAKPIREQKLLESIAKPASGACVTFVGRVRRMNRKRRVTMIEYEAACVETHREFRRIVKELYQKFDILGVRCVHRIGKVRVGETAVWIGVISAHRSPAFAACQYVIDELKKRLPIWKKEHYANGSSDWISSR